MKYVGVKHHSSYKSLQDSDSRSLHFLLIIRQIVIKKNLDKKLYPNEQTDP